MNEIAVIHDTSVWASFVKFPIWGAARLWRDGRLARPGRPDARLSPFEHAAYPASLLQFDGFDRQVPVRLEDREAPLLLTIVGIFIGKELFLEGVFVEGLVRDRGVFKDDGDAVVPAAVFGRVIAGLIHPHLHHAPHFYFFFQERIVILLEELEKFVGVAPPRFVVVLDDERLFAGGSRLGMGGNWCEDCGK